jgi:hypothetical protein
VHSSPSQSQQQDQTEHYGESLVAIRMPIINRSCLSYMTGLHRVIKDNISGTRHHSELPRGPDELCVLQHIFSKEFQMTIQIGKLLKIPRKASYQQKVYVGSTRPESWRGHYGHFVPEGDIIRNISEKPNDLYPCLPANQCRSWSQTTEGLLRRRSSILNMLEVLTTIIF